MQFSSLADALSFLAAFGEEGEKKHQNSPSSSSESMFNSEEVETWFSQVSENIEIFEISMQ